jgi:hypothetical protein
MRMMGAKQWSEISYSIVGDVLSESYFVALLLMPN